MKIKRGASILFVLVFLINFLALASAQNASNVDKGYQCLENKVNGKCSSLTLDEQIFSLLALGYKGELATECKAAVLANSQNNGECWPRTQCTIKKTAQAVLALSSIGENTDKAEQWLLKQNRTSTDLTWFLEIESNNATSCTIKYGGASFPIQIGSDKRINTNAGSCLSLAEGNYWLRVIPECYDEVFEISCTTGFLTTLLYQKPGAAQIYVSSEVNSAVAEGTTTETVTNLCFAAGTRCDYEGSLWATAVLDKNNDVDIFIPYLLALAEDNSQYLPEAFLYFLTTYNDIYLKLTAKQQLNQYWEVSDDKLYDTALTVLMLQYVDSTEKENAKNYFLSSQDANGCWKNHIRDTAFILYAAFPKQTTVGEPDLIQYCNTDAPQGATCIPPLSCEETGGTVLSEYECAGTGVCCSTPAREKSCADQDGILCQSDEICKDESDIPASDATTSRVCCLSKCIIEEEPVLRSFLLKAERI